MKQNDDESASATQRRYRLIAATIVIAALIIVTLAATFEGSASNASCSSVSVIPMAAGGFPFNTQPITLNTLANAEQAVKDKVLVPDVSALGCGFRIVGVKMDHRPTAETINGVTYISWTLSFYVTNQPFVNGTTLNTDLLPHAIIVTESSEPKNSVNSHESAVAFLGPGTSCVISVRANVSSSSCTTQPNTSWNLVQIRNTYLDVAPAGPDAIFEINGVDRAITIGPGTSDKMNPRTSPIMSYDQLLAIASSMIP